MKTINSNITFILPSYNALDYLQWAYKSIRDNLSHDHEIVIVDDGSNSETINWIQSIAKTDSNFKFKINGSNIGIAYTYNAAVNLASNDIVCLLHSDMYVPRGFDEAMLKGLEKYDIVSAARVEPPIYPDSPDKLQRNFGMKPRHFNPDVFHQYIETFANRVDIKGHLFFPWMTTKNIIKSIGGIDLLYLKYMVDDIDFYYRLALKGYSLGTIFTTATYHIPSQSSKHSKDGNATEKSWNDQHMKSTRNFIRKFHVSQSHVKHPDGSYILDMPRPISHSVIMDQTFTKEELLSILPLFEVFSDIVEIHPKYKKAVDDYIRVEKHRTLWNLTSKFKYSESISDIPGIGIRYIISNNEKIDGKQIANYLDIVAIALREHGVKKMKSHPLPYLEVIFFEKNIANGNINKYINSMKTNIEE